MLDFKYRVIRPAAEILHLSQYKTFIKRRRVREKLTLFFVAADLHLRFFYVILPNDRIILQISEVF